MENKVKWVSWDWLSREDKKPITHIEIWEMRMHEWTKNHISKLPVWYMITHDDILRLNYIYIYLSQGKWRWYTTKDIIDAINRFLTKYKLRHFDPYELWIDAWYCDSNLMPIQ